MRLQFHILLLCPLLALWTASAHADGHILKIEGDVAFVSLGAQEGLGAGSKLTLLHTVVAKNPAGGKTLKGTFAIGTLEVLRVGAHLATARAEPSVIHRMEVGSLVRLESERRHYVDPWHDPASAQPSSTERPAREPTSTSDTNLAAQNKAARERLAKAKSRVEAGKALSLAFASTLGKPLDARVLAWQAFSEKYPSIGRRTIESELELLRSTTERLKQAERPDVPPELQQLQTRLDRLQAIDTPMRGPLVQHAPIRAYEGVAVDLAFWLDPRNVVAKAVVFYRGSSSESYQWTQLTMDGDGYLRGTIPADAVSAPGLQYFVEASTDLQMESSAILGDMAQPITVSVEPPVTAAVPDRVGRSQVRLFTDYVDFDGRFDEGFDQYVHMEGDFMYRFYEPVYSVRLGFGNIAGLGGPKDIIDESPNECLDTNGNYQCRRVNYNYVYSDFEFRIGELVALMIRPQFGTGSRDRSNASAQDSSRCSGEELDGCDFFSSFGARGRIRLGDELSSNLTLGFGFVGELGTVFEAAFTWDAIEKVPIVLSAQVADQPVPEDFGVRLVADLGWQRLSWVYPSIRISYQARDVDHDGISGGGAVNFDW